MSDLNILIIHKNPNRLKALLKQNINWAKLNAKIAAIVSSEDAALSLMRQQRYDIIFSDIDICCAKEQNFLNRMLSFNSEAILLPIAESTAYNELVQLLRLDNVCDYIDASLDVREIESALKRAASLYRKRQMGKAADRLMDLNLFDIPTAQKKNIRAIIRSILKDVNEGSLTAMAQDVAILFHETLMPYSKEEIDVSKATAVELIFQLKYYLIGKNLECDDEFVPSSFLPKIQATITNEDLEDLCLYYLRRGVQIINPNGSSNQLSSLVRAAFQITRQRYADSTFTLVSLADEIGISPNYLSSVFKMETGIRFKKYLNSYRIEQAKELLMDSQYKIYEVANLVGIEDSRYFSQIFRTYTGLKPSEYRNAHFNDPPVGSEEESSQN